MEKRKAIYASIRAEDTETRIKALHLSLRNDDIYNLCDRMYQLIRVAALEYSHQENPWVFLDLEAHRLALLQRYEQSMEYAVRAIGDLKGALKSNPYNILDALQVMSIYLDPKTPSYHANASSVSRDCLEKEISPFVQPQYNHKDIDDARASGYEAGYEKARTNQAANKTTKPLIMLDIE